MYSKHENSVKGDFTFMEILLPEKMKIHHMDSYNIEGKDVRFQGAFYNKLGEREFPCNECPIEILKIAKKYRITTCSCTGDGSCCHTTWTIWF